MSLSVGIVGLPNVGKSTLFNALLKRQVALSANYPFATIEPNVGIVEVIDSRLSVLAKLVNTTVIKPATVKFVDIAGLVKGASQGEGLGNKFLANIRETDAICHVLRAFSDSQVIREGSVDPESDLEVIRTELQLADIQTLEKQKQPKGKTSKAEQNEWEIIQLFMTKLNQGKNVSDLFNDEDLSEEKKQLINQVSKKFCLLTAKPELIVVNVDEEELSNHDNLKKQWAGKLDFATKNVVIVSAKVESELAVLDEQDQKMYLQELGIKQSGFDRLAQSAYQVLHLHSFLTAGEKEVRAWTIAKNTTASQAAGVIHSDFEKKFIKVLIIPYSDFVTAGGWVEAKQQGLVRTEGRDYIIQDGEVVEFMIGN